MNEFPRKRASLIWPALIVLVALYPLFGHLGKVPIELWDESRPGIQALEMMHSHNWLTTTYHGTPDMLYMKPPLMIWLNALSMKLFGINEFALRLPTALAALATCLLVYLPFAVRGKAPMAGILAAGILITTTGFVTLHGSRTADYDTLLVLFTTGYIVFYYLYFEEQSPQYLFLSLLFLSLGCITKGVQCLIFAPSMLVYAIYQEKLLALLKEKMLYAGIAVFLVMVCGFYLLREHANPGYIKAVLHSEVLNRYNTSLDGHKAGPFFYLFILAKYYFNSWYLFIIPATAVGLVSKEKWIKDLTILVVYFALLYFAVINNAQTKLFWYLDPLYPILSILVAIFLYKIFLVIVRLDVVSTLLSYNVLPYVFLFFAFFIPYTNQVAVVTSDYVGSDKDMNRINMQAFLQDVNNKSDMRFSGDYVVDDDYNTDLEWYIKAFELKHIDIRTISRKDIIAGDKIFAYLPDTKKFLEDSFEVQPVYNIRNVTLYQVLNKKL